MLTLCSSLSWGPALFPELPTECQEVSLLSILSAIWDQDPRGLEVSLLSLWSHKVSGPQSFPTGLNIVLENSSFPEEPSEKIHPLGTRAGDIAWLVE